jgi:apolipoprotein N-acyltransferase
MNIRISNSAKKFQASLLTSLMLLFAWPANGIAPLLFIAFVPLLILENEVYRQKKLGNKSHLFGWAYLTFFLFNIFTTWWIYFASPFGMFGAVLANSLLMAFVFQLFHITHLRLGDKMGYGALIAFWMFFEYLHMDWDLSWPWLNLGNGFAAWADMVQWYEYTGTQGGTLWIWMVNILIFRILLDPISNLKKQLFKPLAFIIVPIVISLVIKFSYQEKIDPVEVVVVQPNIDPYNEKFSGLSSDQQLEKILGIAAPLVTRNTELVVCPETALPDGIWLQDIYNHPNSVRIKSFISTFPNLRFLVGFNEYEMYEPGQVRSLTSRKFRDSEAYYDVYNAAMQISNDSLIQTHYKSKLVPGVEKMPFPAFFGKLENFAIDLGGITGSLGTSEHPQVFKRNKVIAAPIICYESIYGDYVSTYVRDGANILCIMTNDGWWDDTPGYRQHCQYGRLRAIENRRSIARSANTGISCFINQTGEISDATKWWVPAGIKQTLNLNNNLTVYATWGDYLGKIAGLISLVIGVFLIKSFFRKR